MMRRNRAHSMPPSPFRALAYHQQTINAASHVNDPVSLVRSFDCDTNPSRPIRPSPLTASTIRDLPLELLDRIRSFPLFVSAPDDFLAAIATCLRPQVNAAQDHILTEGDEAKAMYWLVRGVVAVTSRDGEAVYAELKSGAFFGEIGVLMDIPRTATIVARTKCLLVVLLKEDLVSLLPKFPDMERAIMQEAKERLSVLRKKRQEGRRFLMPIPTKIHVTRAPAPGEVAEGEKGAIVTPERSGLKSRKRKSPSPSPGVIEDPAAGSALGSGFVNVRETLKELPLFSKLPADILHFLGLSAQPRIYPPFADIVRQGNPGNEIFFIVRGEAEVIYDASTAGALHAPLAAPPPRLYAGQYFGEVASLGMSPGRTATVRAITTVECLMIGGEALGELWRRCPTSIRSEVEATAWRRYRKLEGDIEAVSSPSAVAARTSAASRVGISPVRTTDGTQSLPAQNVTSTKPDPDPFLSVDMENLRNRRRSSLASLSTGDAVTPGGINGIRSPTSTDPAFARYFFALSHQTPSPESPIPVKRQKIISSSQATGRSPRLVLSDDILVQVFKHLDLSRLIFLRIISRHWRDLLTTSPKVCLDVDLTPCNRHVTDQAIVSVLAPFIGPRPISIDISNCFHITDTGFSCLWRQCGRNVRRWRMRSVWDVSADQILEMSDNAMGLEEIDLSNCRKVGDALLSRVIGWTVPHLPQQQQQQQPVHQSALSPSLQAYQQHQQHQQQRQQQKRRGPPPGVASAVAPPGTVVGCTSLCRLDLSYCKHITDRSMMYLAMHASARIQSLTLTRCTSITDAGFQTWAPFRFPRLTRLCLADCTYLSDKAIVALVSAAKNLTDLDLSFCCALSDTATQVVALGLPRLRTLRLAFCGSAVSDLSLGCVAQHLNLLEFLSVRGCVRVTDTGVDSIVAGCSQLRYLDVSQCRNLNGWLHSHGGVIGRRVEIVVVKGSNGGLR